MAFVARPPPPERDVAFGGLGKHALLSFGPTTYGPIRPALWPPSWGCARKGRAPWRALYIGGADLGCQLWGPSPRALACGGPRAQPPQPLGQTDQREARSGDPHGDTAPFKKMARGSLYAKPDKACTPAPVV